MPALRLAQGPTLRLAQGHACTRRQTTRDRIQISAA
jgi:hypothetical protein